MISEKFNPADHMTKLGNKDYLQVMWRLVWFREEHPDWSIRTEILEHQYGEYAVFKAQILMLSDKEPYIENVLSEGHGSESVKDFKDYLEKAETKAVGRALAMLGYGTQFAPELDEEDRIVDSPVAKKATQTQPTVKTTEKTSSLVCDMCEIPISQAEFDFSNRVYGKHLCRECQKKIKKN